MLRIREPPNDKASGAQVTSESSSSSSVHYPGEKRIQLDRLAEEIAGRLGAEGASR